MQDRIASSETLQTQVKDLSGKLEVLRAENAELAKAKQDLDAARTQALADLEALRPKLASSDKASAERASQLDAVEKQLADAQRDLAALRTEGTRAREAAAAAERDRTSRLAQLQQENTALAARLRVAQSTLEQIASAARVLNGGASFPSRLPPAPQAQAPSSTPAPAPQAAPTRTYVVQEGDTLTRISFRQYGTASRWQDIYDANRDVLRGENSLQPGQKLKIP